MNTKIVAPANAGASDQAAEAAELYRAHGWKPVRIPAGSKGPTDPGWPELAASEHYAAEAFAGCNVGVMLGPASGGLADVDHDCPEALELAPYFLSPTLTFGRASKPASHWLYRAPGARSVQFKLAGDTLLELRAQNASNDRGAQTVFPGSIHPTGEAIDWDSDADGPAEIEAGELRWHVGRLAVACVILRGWVEDSGRHEKSKGLAGGLLKLGWTADEVRDCMAAVRECAGDSDANEADFAHDVETTIEAFENGAEVTGFGTLVNEGLMSEVEIKAINAAGKTPEQARRDAQLASTAAGKHAMMPRLIAEARDVRGFVDAGAIVAACAPANEPRALATADDPLDALGTDPGWDAACIDLDWLCEGLQLAPGKISLLSAYAGGAKTPTAALIALCVAAGLPCLGHETRRAPVAYLAAEGGRNARRKMLRIAAGLGLDVRALASGGWLRVRDAHALGAEACASLESAIAAHGLGLVVVDTLTSSLRGAEVGRNDEAYARMLWDLGAVSEQTRCVVLGLAHDNKSARGGDLRGTSGTSAIVEAAQTVIRLETAEADHTSITIACARGVDDRFAPMPVRWIDGDGTPGDRIAARRGVGVPLRCVPDTTPPAGGNKLNDARARDKAETMSRAAPRVLDALASGVTDDPGLRRAAGDISARALSETLARLGERGVIVPAGYGQRRLGDGWEHWPSPELKTRLAGVW